MGLAFAQLLYTKGAKAVIIGDIALTQPAQEFVTVAQKAKDTNKDACSVYFTTCDVRKWDDLEALLSFAESKCGGESPDIYVPSAGISEMVNIKTNRFILTFIKTKMANSACGSCLARW